LEQFLLFNKNFSLIACDINCFFILQEIVISKFIEIKYDVSILLLYIYFNLFQYISRFKCSVYSYEIKN